MLTPFPTASEARLQWRCAKPLLGLIYEWKLLLPKQFMIDLALPGQRKFLTLQPDARLRRPTTQR